MSEKLEKAKRYHQNGELEAAYDLYQEILKAEPENLEARFYYGVLARQTGNPETAIEICSAGRHLAPDNYLFYALTGECYRDMGKYDHAIDFLKRARALNKHDIASLINLGVCYEQKGDLTQAVAHLQRAVDLKEDFGPAWTKYAIALRKLAKKRGDKAMAGEALKALKTALELEPRDPEAWAQLGQHYLGERDMEKAAEYSFKALELRPNEATAQNTVATLAIAEGRVAEAVDILNAAAHMHPGDTKILHTLGRAFDLQNELKKAVLVYERILEIAPGDITAQERLGRLHHNLGDFDKAAAHYEKAVKAGKADAETLKFHGLSLMRAGRREEARKTLDKALAAGADAEAEFARDVLAGKADLSAAPADFVAGMFDGFAEDFDETLTGRLNYKTPELLHEAVAARRGEAAAKWRIADLGCGTGLCGPLFRDMAAHMTGSDLSPRMIEKAGARGVYDDLRTEDLLATLKAAESPYDLVLAADVFVYIGDLAPVFAATAQALSPGGLFAFSTEEGEAEDYAVNEALRFTHARSYIEKLAGEHGLKIAHAAAADIRYEGGAPVKGGIYVLEKAA